MTGAELLVRCLANEGLEYMFGVPGEENLAVLDAMLDSKIRFLQTRHEQGAAFMADVQGRLTGHVRPGLSAVDRKPRARRAHRRRDRSRQRVRQWHGE